MIVLDFRTPQPPRVDQATYRDLVHACDAVRLAIAQAQSVAEAYQIYRWVQALERELAALTTAAGRRCDELLEADHVDLG